MRAGWSALHGQYTQLAYNSLQRPGARCGRHCSDVQRVRTGPGRHLSLDQNRLTALYCRALDALKRRGCRVDPQRSRAPVNDCERCAVDTTLLVPGGTGTPWSTAPDVADSCGPVLRHATSGPPQEKHTPPRAPRKWCNLHHFHPGSRRMKRRIFVATTKSLDTTYVVICYAGRCVGFPTSDIIIAAPRATHTLQARLWSRRTCLDLGFLQRLTNTLQAGAWQFRLIMRSR